MLLIKKAVDIAQFIFTDMKRKPQPKDVYQKDTHSLKTDN